MPMQALIEHGAGLDDRDVDGDTPLIWAVLGVLQVRAARIHHIALV